MDHLDFLVELAKADLIAGFAHDGLGYWVNDKAGGQWRVSKREYDQLVSIQTGA